MDKRLLLITFHFPPIQGSSGVHRSLSLSRYLPEHGWDMTVLTASTMAYQDISESNYQLIPENLKVIRALALDAPRHLAFKRRYLSWSAVPDRWVSWLPAAVCKGFMALRKQRSSIIFSTYPIASSHIIAWLLHRLTGLPWVAEFRDPMAQDDYPPDKRTWKAFRWIENRVFANATRLVFTAPSAIDYYRKRFPQVPLDRYVLIENGYDEELFAASSKIAANEMRSAYQDRQGPVFLHSGILYRIERDPTAFFEALVILKQEGLLEKSGALFVFRASGDYDYFSSWVAQQGLSDSVIFLPSLNYSEALCEMSQADVLMVFQSRGCNFQIPAKLYEYFRTGRPVIGICDPDGDTATLMKDCGFGNIADMTSTREISDLLRELLKTYPETPLTTAKLEHVEQFSRQSRCALMADLLDEVWDEYQD